MSDKNEDSIEERIKQLKVLDLLEKGKKTSKDMAEKLGLDEGKVDQVVEKLKDKGYIKEDSKAGEMVFQVTERGKKEIPELVEETVEETGEFVEDLKETFKDHLKPLIPKIKVEMPEEDD